MSDFGIKILNMALTVFGKMNPSQQPLVDGVKRLVANEAVILPLAKDALIEGPDAFAAAKAKAPDLFNDLANLAGALKTDPGAHGGAQQIASDAEIAVVAAHAAGTDPPGWTDEDTQRWFDRASGGGTA